ncbi:terminase small subunit [Sphingomonas sp. ABOLF]|uniref:terminase small subunit n=1 Tax=Sphingomonas sp. ABOLF TaxID=1985879 RepID=UPI000F7E3E9C|nr:terminase small subunit [Sphingomonas sp. ABOLF]RSV15668.1 terminase small subunit [Sphingomonas sp. ABOLF]
MTSMTPKQQRFVEEYLIDLNATQAAIRAGYAPDSADVEGCRLLGNAKVAQAIAGLKAERSERTKIDADYVLTQAVKLHERCMQEVEPVLGAFGVQVKDEQGRNVFKFNAAGAAKALELVGKHVDVQAFKDTMDVNLSSLTPAERRARIAELEAKRAQRG